MFTRIKNSRFFKNKEGNVVLYQRPNLPLILWLGLGLTSMFFDSSAETFLSLMSYGFGFAWAYGEASSGVNGFRKTLGYLALIGLIIFALYRAQLL